MSTAVTAELIDDYDDGREVHGANIDAGGALSAMTRSEIDMQVATAKKYPRDVIGAVKKMESIACMDEETAASCFYTLPRGGKTIQGESVRLAEIAIACYGNLRAGTRIVSVEADGDTPHVVAQAAFHDVENNVMVTIEKRRRITKKKSKSRPDEDDIQLACDACSSIALRVATFRVVPKSLIRRVYLKAKAVAVGDASTLINKRASVIEKLQKMGPTLDRILAVVEVKRVEDVDLEKLETLIGLGTAIKDGAITVDIAFPEVPTAGGKVAESPLNEKFAGKKQAAPKQDREPGDEPPTLADRFAACKTPKEATALRDEICNPDSDASEDEMQAAQELFDSAVKRINAAKSGELFAKQPHVS